MKWLLYAFLAIIFFSIMILLFKKVTLMGISSAVLLLFVSIFLTAFFVIHLMVTNTPTTNLNNKVLLIILIAAFFSYLGNFFYVKSIGLAPNPGYSVAINGLQAVVITILSIFLFQAEITILKGVGIGFAVLAVLFLAL